MSSISTDKRPTKILPEMTFLIIDNKSGRKFVTLEIRKIKLSKKIIKLDFFKEKELNTYWDLSNDDNYVQITEKEFKNYKKNNRRNKNSFYKN